MKQFESFRLDTSNACLWQGGHKIALPPKPFGVLRYLVEHPGRLVTHDELLEALWPETYVQPQVLRTYVQELRKVLGDDAARPRFIETLPKRGYCFAAPVQESDEAGKGAAPRLPVGGVPAAERQEAREIVGRGEELGLLMARVELLEKGQRQFVFVTGEAGVGKTALVEDFCRRVGLMLPMRVAQGQCIEGFGSRDAYYPVMEALEQICAGSGGKAARQIVTRQAPGWLQELGGGVESLAVGAEGRVKGGERGIGELCAALEAVSAETPLLLVFEDLQWADPATLHWISALARRQAGAQLMVLMTDRHRPAAATERQLASLKQDLLMRRLCVELTLEPLQRAAVGELLRAELKQEELPSELATFVHRHAEGNPLFVITIVEHLIAQRMLVRAGEGGAARWKLSAPLDEVDVGVPAGLAQMIELEIESLTAQERRMLEAGSLTEIVFQAWAVAAVLGEDVVEIEEGCDGLARRLYFLRRCGEDELPNGMHSAFYVFAHGLYREVLYQRQSASRRERGHMRIAERLGQLFLGREASVAREIALHYEAACSWRNAVDALRAAAWHAQQRQAYSEAAELLERGLRVAGNLGELEGEGIAREIRGELQAALADRA